MFLCLLLLGAAAVAAVAVAAVAAAGAAAGCWWCRCWLLAGCLADVLMSRHVRHRTRTRQLHVPVVVKYFHKVIHIVFIQHQNMR